MAGNLTRFDSSIGEAVQEQGDQSHGAQADFMTGIAQRVVENGGYCDDLTFATAFFGGIDPDMNWSNRWENEQIAAKDIPREFTTALKVAELIRFSVFEPFVAFNHPHFRSIDGIGIIMPGSEAFGGDTIGFKIEQPKPEDHAGRTITGSIVFNGLSKLRHFRPYNEHAILKISREPDATDTEIKALISDNGVGVAAVRQHVIQDSLYRAEEFSDLDGQVAKLKIEARRFERELSAVEVG